MDEAKAEMDNEKDDTKKAALKEKYEAAKKTHDEAVAAAEARESAAKSAEASKATMNTSATSTNTTTTGSGNTIAMGPQSANTVQQPFTNKNSIKDGMSQLSPAAVNTESVNPMMQMKAPGMATGTNAQKEQAYNMLSSVGGGGDALAQQTEMINNLKSIEPILNTAQNFLDKFENSSISKMFSGSGGFPGMSLLTGGAGGNKASPAPVGE